MDIDVAGDELHIVGVRQHHVVEDLQRELGELDGLASAGLDLGALFLVDAAADSAGQAPVGMHAPAAHHLDQGVAVVPHFQDVLGHVHADLGHDAQDVPLGRRGRGADDEVGPAQGVKMRRVVGGEEDAIKKLAELLGRRRRIDVEQGVQGLGGRQVMGLGADAADPRRQVRHVLGRPAHAKLLETPQLRDLQIGVGHVALVVQKDVDLAVTFEPGDGINGNAFHRKLQGRTGLTSIGLSFVKLGVNASRKTAFRDKCAICHNYCTFCTIAHSAISSSAATGCWPD